MDLLHIYNSRGINILARQQPLAQLLQYLSQPLEQLLGRRGSSGHLRLDRLPAEPG
jgi:hypothetical protein